MKKTKKPVAQPKNFLTDPIKHKWIILAAAFISYILILPNEFTLIDDYGTFVTNPLIQDFWKSIADLRVQTILYTIFYHLFGITAIPHHIMSLSLHLGNSYLFYIIFSQLFGLPIAFIAALLFAVHPVNSEAVAWISGNPYLFNAMIYNLTLYYFIRYRITGKRSYLYKSIGFFCAATIFFRTVWLLILPLILAVVDQFFIRKKLELLKSAIILLYAVPITLYILLSMSGQVSERLATREAASPLNQQLLKPMVEGIPYTIATMSKLYIYPDNLMIYYDGNPITKTYYIGMYIVAALYIALTLILLRIRRVMGGIMIMLVFVLAPTMAPIKLVWFMSERYLYYGTGFFTLALALIMGPLLESKKYKKAAIFAVAALMITYTVRTIIRVTDYRNTETIAKATVATSPLGLRGHDDLANSYLIKNDYKTAMPIYHTSLTLVPDANTPVSNLGLIYLQFGLPESPKFDPPRDNRSSDALFHLGESYYRKNVLTNAAFYLYQSYRNDNNNTKTIYLLAETSLKAQNYPQAEKLYRLLIEKAGMDIKIFNKLAYTASWQGKYDQAHSYLQQALNLDPNDKETLSNMLELQKLVEKNKKNLGPSLR